MLSNFLRKYWWFILILIAGFIAQIFVESHEESISEYPTKEISIDVEKSVYISGGTVTGKSFVKVISKDGVSYQMPLEEMITFRKGDKLLLNIPVGYKSTEKDIIPVASYSIIEKTELIITPGINK